MNVAKLTEERLKGIFSFETLERAEGSIGQFYDCIVKSGDLHGKIRGNHGFYTVTLHTSKTPLTASCDCQKNLPCKHAAALGLSYIFTPWIFTAEDSIDRSKLTSLEEIRIYISLTPLKQILEELRDAGLNLSKISELTGISSQQIAGIARANEHAMGNLLKMACLFLLDSEVIKNK